MCVNINWEWVFFFFGRMFLLVRIHLQGRTYGLEPLQAEKSIEPGCPDY